MLVVVPPSHTVRVARAADEATVLAIDAAVGASNDERQQLVRDTITHGTCLIDERESVAVGFAVLRPRHFYGRDFIELLVVTANARRQGAGRALLRHAMEAATTTQVFTSTNRSNEAMQALLESEAWTFSGELTGLDDGDPELVYFRVRSESDQDSATMGA